VQTATPGRPYRAGKEKRPAPCQGAGRKETQRQFDLEPHRRWVAGSSETSGGPAATGRAGPRYSAALPEVSASSFSARARLPAASIFFSSLASTRSLIDWFQ